MNYCNPSYSQNFWGPYPSQPFQNTLDQILTFLLKPKIYTGIWKQGMTYQDGDIVLYGSNFYQLQNIVVNAQLTPIEDTISYVLYPVLSDSTTSAANVYFQQIGAGSISRSVQSKLQETISPEDFGAVGDGIADDTSAWNKVLAIANAGPGTVKIVATSKVYKLTAGLTVNSTFCSVDGDCLMDFSSTLGITGLTITSSISPDGGNHYGRKGAIKGLRLKGPAVFDTSGSIGIKFDSPIVGSTPGPLLERVMVFNWDIGHSHQNTSYISAGIHCEVYACRTGLESIPGADAGERITYIDSTIYNNLLAIASSKVDSAFHFVTCSLDYNSKLALMTAGKAFLVNCHVEASDYANAPIELSGNGTTFVMRGGWLLNTGALPNTIPAWAEVDAGSYCGLFPDFVNNARTATDYWFNGVGRYEIKYCNSFDTTQNPRYLSQVRSYLADGNFELNSISADLRFIATDTAAITNQYTGTNTAISISNTIARSGTRSLRWSKAGVAATEASIVLAAIPVKYEDKVGGTFWVRKPNTSTGTVFLDFRYARIEWVGGIPTLVRSVVAAQQNFVLSSADSGWVQFTALGNDLSIQTMPPWANYAVLVANGISWIASGDFIYFDDVILDIVG